MIKWLGMFLVRTQVADTATYLYFQVNLSILLFSFAFRALFFFKTSIYKLTIGQSVIFKQKGFQWRHRKHHDVRVPGHFSLSLSRADRCISVQKLISFKLFP